MIDKKPFRVTNEQAISDKSCGLYCPDCDLALSKPEGWKCPHGETHVSKYAADLLDARDLIDKQEALIKEMREEISIVVSTASSETTKSELSYISNYTEMRDLLKKTKDYA